MNHLLRDITIINLGLLIIERETIEKQKEISLWRLKIIIHLHTIIEG